MSASPQEVERIVREVLARLEPSPEPPGAAAGLSSSAGSTAGSAAPVSGTFAVASRVVTLLEVAPRLATIGRLVVPPGAVVTPAVRDALRDRGIALSYGPPEPGEVSYPARLVLVAALVSLDPAAVVELLGKEGLCVEASRSDCLVETSDRLAEALSRPGTLGVVLTSHVAAALCLTNRLRGLRAVSAAEPEAAVAAARSVGANVLIQSPRGTSPHRIARTIARFAAAGPYPCPEALRGRLA